MRSPSWLLLLGAVSLCTILAQMTAPGSALPAPRDPLQEACVQADAAAGAAPREQARASVAATRFTPNLGQWDAAVRFAVLGDTAAWLHGDGFTVRLERWNPSHARREPGEGPAPAARQSGGVVRTRFVGGLEPVFAPGPQLVGTSNFFFGRDPAHWQVAVPSFATVRMQGVHPGIDVVFRPLPDGARGPFEYDLVLAPGADLGRFVARCEGAEALHVDAAGRLCVAVPTPEGSMQLVHDVPIAWQDGPAGRRPLHVRYRVLGDLAYGFEATDLDPALPATVDPGVVWSTFLGGGSSDSVNDLCWQPGAGVWVAGWAGSTDFPTTVGAYRTTGGRDGFVARLDDSGTQLQFATYLGGGLGDEVRGLDLGPGNTPTVVGFTRSLDFPVTAGAFQPTYAGASLVLDLGDAFVARFSAAGDQLLGSTYLGGVLDEAAEAVAVDTLGHAFVAGWTASPNFPTTAGAWQPSLNGPVTLQTDGFVARIAPDARTASYSTYAGGNLPDQLLDVDLDAATGQAVAVGWSVSANFPTTPTAYRTTSGGLVDIVAVRLQANGGAPVFSTYLGGIDTDIAHACTLAADGSLWLGGLTRSSNFPTTLNAPQRVPGGADDGIVCRLAANGQSLLFSTLLGGAAADIVRGLDVDGSDVLAVGETGGGFPVTPNAVQGQFGGGGIDAFAAHFTNGGNTLAYSTYLGGLDQEVLDSVVLASSGLAVLAGWSFSADFATTPLALQSQLRGVEDGVVLQLDLLADLGDGLEVVGLPSPSRLRFVGAGDSEALAVSVRNTTSRRVLVEALRLLVSGRGSAPAQVRGLRIYEDDAAVPGEWDRLVAGPTSVLADDAEQVFPLVDVGVDPGAEVRLRVVLDLRGLADDAAVELACTVVGTNAWTVRAVGFGSGPAVRVLGSGRAEGAVLVLGALPGDADLDGRRSVFDLRLQCARLGEPDRSIDCDEDGVLTVVDLGLTQDALLGRSSLVAAPAAVVRGSWFTLSGVFPVDRSVEAALGGRSLVVGRLTPRELTLRVDANQTAGLQDLVLTIDGRAVGTRAVLVQ